MLKVKGLEKRLEQEAQYDENFKDVRTHRQKRESEYKTKVCISLMCDKCYAIVTAFVIAWGTLISDICIQYYPWSFSTQVQARKCEKRLELTRQSGTWVPRLERLVASRGLSSFEKNLLLTLIGSIIQPNKINNCGDINPYTTTSSFSVGELLRLFCTK